MIKHSRKRQKLDSRQPLGSSNGAAAASEKDDEERRLEELIFGVPFVPSAVDARKSQTGLLDDGDEEEVVHSTGKELDGLLDSDVRFLSISFCRCSTVRRYSLLMTAARLRPRPLVKVRMMIMTRMTSREEAPTNHRAIHLHWNNLLHVKRLGQTQPTHLWLYLLLRQTHRPLKEP